MQGTVKPALLLALVAAPLLVHGSWSSVSVGTDAVYKCEQGGQVTFQDTSCPPGATQTPARAEQPSQEKSEPTPAQKRKAQEAKRRLAEKLSQRRSWSKASLEPSRVKAMRQMIKYAFEKVLHDPDSLEIARWGEMETNGYGYRTKVTYRALNKFGAKVLSSKRFYFDENRVIERMEEVD